MTAPTWTGNQTRARQCNLAMASYALGNTTRGANQNLPNDKCPRGARKRRAPCRCSARRPPGERHVSTPAAWATGLGGALAARTAKISPPVTSPRYRPSVAGAGWLFIWPCGHGVLSPSSLICDPIDLGGCIASSLEVEWERKRRIRAWRACRRASSGCRVGRGGSS